MGSYDKQVEVIREALKSSSLACAHDSPGGTLCSSCKLVTLLAAYDEAVKEVRASHRAVGQILCPEPNHQKSHKENCGWCKDEE